MVAGDDGRLSAALRPRHPADDLVLNLQDAPSLGVEAFRPKLTALPGLNQLNVHAHPLPLDRNAAVEQVTHVQLTPDLSRICVLALVGERRGAGDHGDAGHRMREIADETVGNPIGHEVLRRIAAEIDKRKNDDRRRSRCEPIRRRLGLPAQRNRILDVRRGQG
jgi:hypothetical protein